MTVPSILTNPTFALFLLYLTLELLFYLLYHLRYVPRANALGAPADVEAYRDYGRDRHALMLRILNRIERTAEASGKPVLEAMNDFLWDWFYRCGNNNGGGGGKEGAGGSDADASVATEGNESTTPASVTSTSASSSSSSSLSSSAAAASEEVGADGNDHNRPTAARPPATGATTTSTTLRRGDADDFFSWAFFGKHHPDLLPWEETELAKIYSILETRGLRFDSPGRTPGVKPMRLTLDEVSATYRPFVVYGFFMALNLFGRLALRVCGFQRRRTESGLAYWFRDESKRLPSPSPSDDGDAVAAADERQQQQLPLLFFHGIAPGGLALYLPMILWGFGGDGGEGTTTTTTTTTTRRRQRRRAMFLFENGPISFSPCFEAVDEDATVAGVLEALDRHLGLGPPRQGNGGADNARRVADGVALVGHSFGSCQLTWMLRSPEIRAYVRQIVLMDPVSVLLSEPDVMTNFLYKQREVAVEEKETSSSSASSPASSTSVSLFRAVRPILLFPLFYLLDLFRPSSAYAAAKQTSSSSSFFRSSSSGLTDRPPPIDKGRYNKIWMVQSELFIEHYLRRNFAWYNSEIWLEDVPPGVKALVCVSGNDEILNPRKVRREVLARRDAMIASGEGRCKSDLELIYWPDAGHAYSVPRPWTWRQIRSAMGRQEEAMRKEAAVVERCKSS